MIQAILNFFGIGKNVNTESAKPLTEGKTKAPSITQEVSKPPTQPPAAPRQPQISLKKAQARKGNTNPKHYYRRNGSYYSVEDDSLIEDLILLYVLSELFTENDVQTFEEMEQVAFEESQSTDIGSTAPAEEDLLDIDVSETPVVEAAPQVDIWKPEPEPAYVAPEPEPVKQDSYSSGYSDSSSSYDSGSSDSGGGSDD